MGIGVMAILASTSCGVVNGAERVTEPPFLRCSKTPVDNYWRTNGKEFVVIYSMQGLYYDLKARLPKDIFELIISSSDSVLSKYSMEYVARDIGATSYQFYDALQEQMAASAGVSKGQCAQDISSLVRALNGNYKFILRGNTSEDWFDEYNINELNVRNDQFIVFLSKVVTTEEQLCMLAFSENEYQLTICR